MTWYKQQYYNHILQIFKNLIRLNHVRPLMYRICTQRRQTINLTFYNQIIRIIDEKTTDKAKILHTLLAEMSTIISLIFSATIKRKFKLSRSHGGWEDDKKNIFFTAIFLHFILWSNNLKYFSMVWENFNQKISLDHVQQI